MTSTEHGRAHSHQPKGWLPAQGTGNPLVPENVRGLGLICLSCPGDPTGTLAHSSFLQPLPQES